MRKKIVLLSLTAILFTSCDKEKKELLIEQKAVVAKAVLITPEVTADKSQPYAAALKELNQMLADLEQSRGDEVRTAKEISFVQKRVLEPALRGKAMLRSAMKEVKEDTLLYLVNFENEKGYAVLDARNSENPVIALTHSGSISPDVFTMEHSSITLQSETGREESEFKNMLSEVILSYVLLPDSLKNKEESEENFDDVAQNGVTIKRNSNRIVEEVKPLLKTKWNQGAPYNKYTPIDKGYKTSVGCVAVALAQIVAYKEFPSILNFPKGNTCTWARLNGKQNPGTSLVEWEFLQLFLLKIGMMCVTKYEKGGSSANFDKTKFAFQGLGYKYIIQRPYDFIYVRNMVSQNKPILTGGLDKKIQEGHAWVIDGYRIQKIGLKRKNYVHCNYGWGGLADGDYLSRIFNPIGKDEKGDPQQLRFTSRMEVITYGNPK